MPAKKPLKICFATAELAPMAKTGGLADVSSALSMYLQSAGHDTRVLMPWYATIDSSDLNPVVPDELKGLEIPLGSDHVTVDIARCRVPDGPEVHLLKCDRFFGGQDFYGGEDEHLRFILLTRAAIEMCRVQSFAPDIFHCHDWHTALAPVLLKTLFADDPCFASTRSVLTLHNIGYQGVFGRDCLDWSGLQDFPESFDGLDLDEGRVNFLKTGVIHADLLTTVSPTYAREILHHEYGMGLEWQLQQRQASLVGILNGVDYEEWNPETDTQLPVNYSARNLEGKEANKRALMEQLELDYRVDRPLLGMVTRLTHQKGLELVQQVMPDLLGRRDLALAVVGTGEDHYEEFFNWLQQEFPGQVAFFNGYSEELAHRVEAGADAFIMPSRYEPCGLNQMYSLRYGTVPVVRATGGLADSVQHFDPVSGTGTGVVFHDFDANGLRWALDTTLDFYGEKFAWKRMVQNGMSMNYSWEEQGAQYVERFRRLLA